MKNKFRSNLGFTLIESLVGIAIFIILMMAVYQISNTVLKQTRNYRESTTIAALADEYLEIARNLPYLSVGTTNGNPSGSLPDQPNATTTLFNGNTYQIYYEVTYRDDPADGSIASSTDSAPNDFKQVKLNITNVTTNSTYKFLTTISPKGLEYTANSGALFIKVFDAVGQPVSGASIHITNTLLNPDIDLTRTSDSNGNWIEVGLPDSINSYHVVVTKSGYSSDQTYPSNVANPSPTKPDATIANAQVTQISFSIDRLSSLTFNTLDDICAPIPTVDLNVKGSKIIGIPNVLKFSNNYTSDSSGIILLNPLEWDTYTPTLQSSTYMIYGSSPIQQVSILPNTSQTFSLILGPKTTNSLLVIVKDAATGNPIKGANVDLQTISPPSDNNKLTGGSIWGQQSWEGGDGQINFTSPDEYFEDNGNVTTNAGGVRLVKPGATYITPGSLTSSTFDTGTASSSYTTISWQPTSQDPNTSLKFQIATNNDNATWDFVGPSGDSSTYYTVPGTSISAVHTNNRYVRYKAYLRTEDPNMTPVLTSVSINYVSGCFTPGQVIFPGLTAGSNYRVVTSMPGYQTQTTTGLNISGYNVLQILLTQ